MRSLLLTAITATALAPSLNAIVIPLNPGNAPKPGNSGKATIEGWLTADIRAYNLANNPFDLPVPSVPNNLEEAFRVNSGDSAPADFPSFGKDTLTLTIPSGDYDYLALHWGGKGGGVYQSFYIGDLGGDAAATLEFKAPSKNGLSWYSLFSPTSHSVPDAGSTVALLGVGLLGLAFLRRQAGFR